MSRRALLGATAAGSMLLGIQGVGQSVGGPLRELAFLLPRGETAGAGPNDFPVNGTFASLGLPEHAIGPRWRLRVSSADGHLLRLSREELSERFTQHSYWLPIACREGWTMTQRWTGVRLRDLAAAVGVPGAPALLVEALDGATATLASNQVSAEESLLALSVNGVPISPDHGYPARVIVPGEIAVNCLKWVDVLQFGPSAG